MYCDASFGPALVRREFSSQYAEKFSFRQDLLLEFIINENLRVIHCPDCLFHSNVAELKGSGIIFEKLSLEKSKIDFFVFFIEIYHSAEEVVSKSALLEISRKLVLNVISIDDKIFKYTCNEAGIRCNPDMHTRGLMGYLQEN